MKKHILLILTCLMMALNAKAQYYVPDDINGDSKVSMADVPVLVDHLLNNKQDSICAVEVYENGKLIQTYTNTSDKTYKVKFIKYVEPKDTHEYVDLGLPSGTLWAKTNIGAETETDAGLYFAWGETTGYTSDTSDGHSFNWANYKWMTSGQSTSWGCTKYTFADGQTSGCWYSNDTYVGTTVNGIIYTNLTKLESSDDAATANWGSNWRMPTQADMQELVNNTDCSWATLNNVLGYRFANKSDASKYIFLPITGLRDDSSLNYASTFGFYWSSELNHGTSGNAYILAFASGGVDAGYNYSRYCGQSVRPVYATKIEKTKVSSITLSSTSLSLEKGGTSTLTATVAPDDAFLKTYTWNSSNTSVATVDADGKVTAVANGTATITCTANDGSGVSATCSVTVGDLPVYWFASNSYLYEGDIPQTYADAINTSKYELSSPIEGFYPPRTTAYNNGYTLTADHTSDIGWFIVPTSKASIFKIYSEKASENVEGSFEKLAFSDKPEYTLFYITETVFVTKGGTLKVYYNTPN